MLKLFSVCRKRFEVRTVVCHIQTTKISDDSPMWNNALRPFKTLTFWSSPGHHWTVQALWCISAGDLWLLWSLLDLLPWLRCVLKHQNAGTQISPTNKKQTSNEVILPMPTLICHYTFIVSVAVHIFQSEDLRSFVTFSKTKMFLNVPSLLLVPNNLKAIRGF